MTGRKILIVDDDRDFLRELGEALRLSGYEVLPCREAKEAVRFSPLFRPDLALLDLKLAHESGFRLAGEIRKLPGLERVPIIAMTGCFTSREHEMMMRFCGMSACLIKPFPASLAAEAIEKHLAAGPGERSWQAIPSV